MKHGICNDVFNFILFSPFIKDNRKVKNDSDNYCVIAFISCFYKLFNNIIINHFKHVLKFNGIQFAYVNECSTTQCTVNIF